MSKLSEQLESDEQLSKLRREREKMIARVMREESLAKKNPGSYRRRVYAYMCLAYGFLFGVLGFALLLVGFLIYSLVNNEFNSISIRLGIILGLLIFAIVRSLIIKIEPPNGLVLKRDEAPELYREVDAIADRLRAPRPHEIRIDSRLNAAASQTPRFGLFGSYRNVLLLGMPLLLGLEPAEMRAVIAHEFGHFSGSHGKFGARAYRVNATWHVLHNQLVRTNQGISVFVLSPFVNWF